MDRSSISQEKFTVVYHIYNGVLCHIAKHLGINHRTAKKLAIRYNLKPYLYLSVPEAARRLNIPRSTLEYWIYSGKFPSVQATGKKNQYHMITEQTINDYLSGRISIEYPQRMMQNGYISVTQAARKLNYSIAMVRRMCQQGRLQAKKNSHGMWMIKL